MTTYYVDATPPGSNTNPYDTWAKAALLLSTINGLTIAAGDTIYLEEGHSESTASSQTYATNGTTASLTKIICASKSATPPTASSTGAKIARTGASSACTFTGSFYLCGLTIEVGSGGTGTSPAITTGGNTASLVVLQDCTLRTLSPTGGNVVAVNATTQTTIYRNTTVKFSASGAAVSVAGAGDFRWEGGGLEAGTTSPTTLITGSTARANVWMTGLDLSAGASGMNLFTAGNYLRCVIRDCKLPGSWSGAFVTGTDRKSVV